MNSAHQSDQTNQTTLKATFAGGCFWCIQHAFEDVDGIISSTVGYTGGKEKNPTYELVSSGNSSHIESLELIYDPKKITYEQLLNIFWRNIDPTVKNRQFCDVGTQYKSAIFYHNEQQKQLAESAKDNILKSGKIKTIHTDILPAQFFYNAEDYHQFYYKKNPVRYNIYRYSCGRDDRLSEIWGEE